jgi:hypothetical protein
LGARIQVLTKICYCFHCRFPVLHLFRQYNGIMVRWKFFQKLFLSGGNILQRRQDFIDRLGDRPAFRF